MNYIRFTTDLMAQGWSSNEIARLARQGELTRIRRGAYEPPSEAELNQRESHKRLIAATIRQTPTEAVLSHMSAAVLHGLPTWSSHLARVHLTRDQRGGGKIRRYTHLHVAPLPESDVCMIDNVRVTAEARTVLDLLRCLPMEKGVPIGDAALRAGVSLEQLAEVAGRCIGWRGMSQARRSLAFLDGRSESVGESSSRVVIHRLGLPAPTPQLEVFTDQGLLVGRADFGWKELRTLGEYDGKTKYGELLKPDQTMADVLYAEKQREDALRDLGWQIVRWVWKDLSHPEELKMRLERAFARGLRAA
jgi:hypothetical protein